MKAHVMLLRITLWWGIIADAVETARMFFPSVFIESSGAVVTRDPGFDLALRYGAPVMLGWTLLLIWADRKPMERKGILLCLVPVVISYFVVEVIAIRDGVLRLGSVLPAFILQTVLLLLIALSYSLARAAERKPH